MLLYCHINLRVMKPSKNDEAGCEDSNSFEDFIGQALLEEPVAPPAPAENAPPMKEDEPAPEAPVELGVLTV